MLDDVGGGGIRNFRRVAPESKLRCMMAPMSPLTSLAATRLQQSRVGMEGEQSAGRQGVKRQARGPVEILHGTRRAGSTTLTLLP